MTTREQKEEAAREYDRIEETGSISDGFIKGAEWAESKMKWIPVSERMPPLQNEDDCFSIDCLLFIKTDHSHYIRVGYHGVGWNVYGILDLKNECVTHWMPLPELPKQEDEKPASNGLKQINTAEDAKESVDFIKLWAMKRCGDCYYWMKSSECPAEKNIDGQSRGPSMNGLICKKFKQDPFKDRTKGGKNE